MPYGTMPFDNPMLSRENPVVPGAPQSFYQDMFSQLGGINVPKAVTPGQFNVSAPPPPPGIDVGQFALQFPKANVPSVQELLSGSEAAFAKLPPVQTYVPQLQQLAQGQVQQLQASLQPLFQRQTEQTQEAIASRGLLGSGPETELLRRLSGEQAGVLQQGVGDIQQRALQSIIQEQQQARGIEETRRNNLMNMSLQTGLSQAQLDAQYGSQMRGIAADEAFGRRQLEESRQMQLLGMNQQAAIAETNADISYSNASLNRMQILLDIKGQMGDEDRDLFNQRNTVWQNINAQAQSIEDPTERSQYLADQYNQFVRPLDSQIAEIYGMDLPGPLASPESRAAEVEADRKAKEDAATAAEAEELERKRVAGAVLDTNSLASTYGLDPGNLRKRPMGTEVRLADGRYAKKITNSDWQII